MADSSLLEPDHPLPRHGALYYLHVIHCDDCRESEEDALDAIEGNPLPT